jgi:hypothetical protein
MQSTNTLSVWRSIMGIQEEMDNQPIGRSHSKTAAKTVAKTAAKTAVKTVAKTAKTTKTPKKAK